MFSIRQNTFQRSTRLPKKNQLLTLDVVNKAQPFVNVVAKNENTYGLDIISNAQPFVAAFNNRLTGPIISVSSNHPDVQNWLHTISWNGGSASSATITALNTFCAAIDNAGIRNKFYRLNLFCGNNLQACLVPLYVGPSAYQIGTNQPPYGFWTDLNFNFISSNYTELTGLVGDGSSKYLDTGLTHNLMGIPATLHQSVYKGSGTWNMTKEIIGARDNDDFINIQMRYSSNSTAASVLLGGNVSLINETPITDNASFLIANRPSSTELFLYQNGIKIATGSNNNTIPGSCSSKYFVFTRSIDNVSAGNPWQHSIRAYSFGLGMTDSEALTYNNIMQTFQTSLNRNV